MLRLRGNTLHIIDTLWLGGAQRVVKTVMEHNISEGKLHLLVLRQTPEMIEVHHPNVHCIPSGKKWNLGTAFSGIRTYVRKHNIQTIHCHLPKSQSLGLLLKLYYKPDLKLIFQEQGDIMDQLPLNLPAYLWGRRHIDHVACCSEAVRSRLLSLTGIDPDIVSILYNFPSIPCLTPSGEKEKGWHIGFAGRFTRHKGWKEFLEAVAAARRRSEPELLTIHMAGSGPDEAKLRSFLCKIKLADQCIMHGFVHYMPDFYRRLDLLCVPSHREPMGMVHVEAMLCGIPVIASDVPGMNEILKHESNSLLFPPGNTEAIMESLLRVLTEDGLAERLKKNGLDTASALVYDRFEQGLVRLYDQLKV